ncbi:hypothetical protein OIU74_015869 [Salix koriyanagi]|uniref:Uncharacterized protein n=1 Tax=Salix koriyanagi TaxID=2511006 RepID=A0A9Q0SVW4_9ROSI|nr:hypothetical protein OIU74_015869 [Salix koriyanagi]
MAKRKAKKKSPSTSSRPPPSCPVRPPASGPSSPTKKQARHSSLPPQSSPSLTAVSAAPSLAVVGSGPLSPDFVALGAASSLAAVGSAPIGVDQAPPIAPLQQPSPLLQVSENSPTFSMMFAPVEVPSPMDSENSYYSDSSSHYGVSKSQASATVLPSSSQAEKVVLSSEGSESVHNSVPLAPPLTNEGLQDPMVCEAAAGVYDWQPAPRKHTSNRQPKIGSVPAALGLGKDSSVSNGKSVEAVGNVSGGTGLTVLGSVAAGSIMGMGCVGLIECSL